MEICSFTWTPIQTSNVIPKAIIECFLKLFTVYVAILFTWTITIFMNCCTQFIAEFWSATQWMVRSLIDAWSKCSFQFGNSTAANIFRGHCVRIRIGFIVSIGKHFKWQSFVWTFHWFVDQRIWPEKFVEQWLWLIWWKVSIGWVQILLIESVHCIRWICKKLTVKRFRFEVIVWCWWRISTEKVAGGHAIWENWHSIWLNTGSVWQWWCGWLTRCSETWPSISSRNSLVCWNIQRLWMRRSIWCLTK